MEDRLRRDLRNRVRVAVLVAVAMVFTVASSVLGLVAENDEATPLRYVILGLSVLVLLAAVTIAWRTRRRLRHHRYRSQSP